MSGAEAVRAAAARRGRSARSWVDVVHRLGPLAAARQFGRAGNSGEVAGGARDRFYRDMWGAAAAELGAETRALSAAVLEIRRDGSTTRVMRQLVEDEDPVALQVALDKPLVHGLLGAAGIPVPAHVALDTDLASATALLNAVSTAVVKPASGTGGGDGTTCGVGTPADLAAAVRRASVLSPRVLVEREVPGTVYRMLFLRGELLDVVRRGAPHVTGDGRSSLGELIAAENARRLEARGASGFPLLRLDLDLALTLARAGRTLASVPAQGERVRVKTATSEGAAEEQETYRGPVAPELIEHGREAERAVGLHLCGLDVITPDITLPLAEAGGVIAEVNGTPGLHHHYHVAEPERATQVAVPILAAQLRAAAAV